MRTCPGCKPTASSFATALAVFILEPLLSLFLVNSPVFLLTLMFGVLLGALGGMEEHQWAMTRPLNGLTLEGYTTYPVFRCTQGFLPAVCGVIVSTPQVRVTPDTQWLNTQCV
eukprot:Sspe_Gene.39067::Locus_18856_Transcript_1_1_Confidence_1.000_Length_1821::g.39067::m.39067